MHDPKTLIALAMTIDITFRELSERVSRITQESYANKTLPANLPEYVHELVALELDKMRQEYKEVLIEMDKNPPIELQKRLDEALEMAVDVFNTPKKGEDDPIQ